MYATIELNEEIISFLNSMKKHTESFEEIKELVFTKERLKKNYTVVEKFNLTLQFQEIKKSAINKALNNQKLNYPEGFLIERLIAKYFDEKMISVEDHCKLINSNCNVGKKTNITLYQKLKNILNINKSIILKKEVKNEK